MTRHDTCVGRSWRALRKLAGRAARAVVPVLCLPLGGGGIAAAQTDVVRLTLDDRLALERRMQGDPWHYEERRAQGGGLHIGPALPAPRALWAGDGPIRILPHLPATVRPPALRIDLRTSAPVAQLALVVTESRPHLRPMLGRRSDLGCHAFAPRLWLENAGWAPVEGATLTLRFHAGDAATEAHTLDLPGFDDRLEVDLTDLLTGFGLDVAALAGAPEANCDPEADPLACAAGALTRLWRSVGPDGGPPMPSWLAPCPAGADPADCAAALPVGPLAGMVRTEDITWNAGGGEASLFFLSGSGMLQYDWTDADGSAQTGSQPLGVTISLAVSALPVDGAGLDLGMLPAPAPMPAAPPRAYGRAPIAPDIVRVALRATGQRYALALALRGNPRQLTRSVVAEIGTARSSVHRLAVQARLADGRSLTSPPVTAQLLAPRPLAPLPARDDCTLPRRFAQWSDLYDSLPHADDMPPHSAGDRPWTERPSRGLR